MLEPGVYYAYGYKDISGADERQTDMLIWSAGNHWFGYFLKDDTIVPTAEAKGEFATRFWDSPEPRFITLLDLEPTYSRYPWIICADCEGIVIGVDYLCQECRNG